ncbi:arginine deiminase [Lutispora saccharofermentans]|uniref:Arginine deiminase n=1 Tax=Lutispora saccharofermentans TaxID=3024236 RepID=A0ABT1NDC8_9FIRM|nr:arginine deiminase [Lutispora saccharofermentans]MCQ1529059.1 arginine deiminase [Lutispora saccharofermentans]
MGDDIDRGLLNVTSEIGKLKAVLLHKPGKELERLTPEYLRQLLFDDIPWLKQMRIEHDEFAEVLRKRGAQVLYVEDLLAEIFENKQVKKNFIHDMLKQCKIDNPELHQIIFDNLNDRTPEELVEAAIGGLQKKEIEVSDREYSLTDYIEAQYPLYINPLPNLYFMRDPAAVMGNGISINSMYTDARRREPMLIKYIYDNHPLFNKDESPLWYDHTIPHSLEGGDMLVLSKEVVAIGCSERTSAQGIEMLARNLFSGMKELKEVVVVRIPPLRAFMHLDTVFTMVDYDKFTIYPGIQDRVEVYSLVRGKSGRINVIPEADLVDTLKRSLGIPSIKLIESGGGDAITAAREQWNDSTNTLAIAPGVVVTYSRNEASNEVLRKNGIEVVEIDGSELVRGRGGPRCMSMPLAREEI